MPREVYSNIDAVLTKIKRILDNNVDNKVNVMTMYAHNGSGKTRISQLLKDNYTNKVLCYNAFVEDFYSWNNENCILQIDTNSWIFNLIATQGLNDRITDNFKDFTGLNIEPDISLTNGYITFNVPTGDGNSQRNIKISRGEESIFVWSIFYTIVEFAIEELNEETTNRSTDIFNNIKYIVIDDPVSSMDDTRIITISLKIIDLIKKAEHKFKFLITTHHALFFNILYCKRDYNWNKENYLLSKIQEGYNLTEQKSEAPFAYHLVILNELQEAISSNNLKKYHFNLFRCILEKTANFLGYKHWKECLKDIDTSDEFLKIIDHYSHDRLAEIEFNNLIEANVDTFNDVFEKFINKYKWQLTNI